MIKASQEVQQYLSTSKPGDRAVYVNMDAIRELPDQFEVVISKVEYDKNNLENDFSNVGSKDFPAYMPDPQLMYRIAEAKGICGGHESQSESIVEEVDINPMLMKPLSDLPTYRKMVVGKRVTKQSYVLQDDGTERWSSPCTIEYNVWERCQELWSKEESVTNGYKTEGKHPSKYDTMYKRKAHFDAEMKFAQSKAETKANLKTIRELAGMMTGFSREDLKTGFLIFSRVRRSQDSLKVEAAAAMATGQKAQAKLFQAPPPVQTEKSKRVRMIEALEGLRNMGGVPADKEAGVKACLDWLCGSQDDCTTEGTWKKALVTYEQVMAGQVGFPSVEEFR